MGHIRGVSPSSRNHLPIPIVHGFVPGRCAITNAHAHIGFDISISCDIKDCFDSTTTEHLKSAAISDGKLKRFIENLSWVLFEEGAARQGLPTSPALANISLCGVDYAVMEGLENLWREQLPGYYYMDPQQQRGIAFDPHDFFNQPSTLRAKHVANHYLTYTRYADDLTISFNNEALVPMVFSAIDEWIAKGGYRINSRKSRVQRASFGNRLITGIAVGSKLQASRETRRKLRAAIHQQNTSAVKGLAEWCKLKLP